MSKNDKNDGSDEEQLLRESPEAVGYRIRTRREDKGYSLTEAANAMGISTSYLSMIEHGRRALKTTDTVAAISTTLNMSPDYILRGIDEHMKENPHIDHRYFQLIQFDHFLDSCSTREISFCLDLCRNVVKEIRHAKNAGSEY